MSRGCIGLPNSYAWGNFAVLALGVWAIAQRDSVDAVVMVNVCINFLNAATFKRCHVCLAIDGAIRSHANDESDML